MVLPSFVTHVPLRRVEAAVAAVLGVDQPHWRLVPYILRTRQRCLLDERVITSVDRHGRHAYLGQPPLGAAAAVVVEFVPEPVDARDVGLVEGADRVAGADLLNAEVAREL